MNSNKIKFITPTVSVGGIQSVVYRLSSKFTENGFKTSVLTFHTEKESVERLQSSGVDVYNKPLSFLKGDLKTLFGIPYLISDMIKTDKCTYISTAGFTVVSTILMSKIFRKKHKFIAIIDNDLTKSTKLHHRIYNSIIIKLSYNLDGVVFTFNGALENFKNKSSKQPDVVELIYNPVEPPSNNRDHKIYDFIYVGRMCYEKAPDIFVGSMKDALKENPIMKSVMLGSGEMLETIKNLTKNTKNIEVLGQVNNVDEYLRKSKCLILPSRFEGCSGVIKEALSNGIPCIVSNVESNAPNEMIGFGKYGSVFMNGESLKDEILSFNSDNYDETEIRRYAERFHVDTVTKQYLDLIKGINE